MNIFLSWTPVSCASPISQRVEYKKLNDANWTLYGNVPCEVSSLYINNLDDDYVYEFRVGALCAEEGLEKSIIYTTHQVLAKLLCPTVTTTSTDVSIDFSFDGSEGDVDDYVVDLLDSTDLLLDTEIVTNEPLISGSFTGLTPSTTYKIRVTPRAYFERFTAICDIIEVTTEEPQIPDCSVAEFDLIIVNDESGSIGSTNYNNYIREGILDIARQTSALIDTGQVRVGVIGFSNFTKTRTVLSDDYPYIYNSISTMGYLGSTTGTAEALILAKNWIDNQARNVPVKVILVTDGFPNKCFNFPSGSSSCTPQLALQQAVDAATNIKATIKGGVPVEIITIGVTSSVGEEFLRDQVATNPTKYYSANTFVEFQAVAQEVALSICSSMPAPLDDPCFAPTAVTASLSYSQNTCVAPNNVSASILGSSLVCNPPTNVLATLRTNCPEPTNVVASLL